VAEQILRMCREAVGRLFTPEASAGARLTSDGAISVCVFCASLSAECGWDKLADACE
jgi:hypothetical protein